MTEPLAINRKASKAISVLVGSLLVFTISVYFVLHPDLIDIALPGRIFAAAIAAFAFAGGLAALAMLLRRGPMLVVDDEGITDCSSYNSIGLIRWREIEGFYLFDYQGMTFLALALCDEEAFISRHGKVAQKLMRWSKSIADTPVAFPVTHMQIQQDEFVQRLQEFATEFQRKTSQDQDAGGESDPP